MATGENRKSGESGGGWSCYGGSEASKGVLEAVSNASERRRGTWWKLALVRPLGRSPLFFDGVRWFRRAARKVVHVPESTGA